MTTTWYVVVLLTWARSVAADRRGRHATTRIAALRRWLSTPPRFWLIQYRVYHGARRRRRVWERARDERLIWWAHHLTTEWELVKA